MVRKSRLICCCSAQNWTKFIAWLQIVIFVILSEVLLVQFVLIIFTGKNTMEKILGKNEELHLLENCSYSGLVAWFIIFLSYSVGGLVTGLYLLKGIKQRNPKFLRTWHIFAAVSIAFVILLSAVFRHASVFQSLRSAVKIIIPVIWTTFLMIIVQLYKLEVERDLLQNPNNDGERPGVFKA